jgi:hypothetical protein
MLIKILKGARLKEMSLLLIKEFCGLSGPLLRAGVRIPFLTNFCIINKKFPKLTLTTLVETNIFEKTRTRE